MIPDDDKISGPMVTRTHYFEVVKGVEVMPDGDIIEQEYVIDGHHEDVGFLKRKIRREHENFIPREFSFHKQKAFLPEEDFYGNASFGDDEEYTPEPKTEKPKETKSDKKDK